MSDSLRPHRLWPTRLLHPWDFPGKNAGWVAIYFSRRPSRPRDWTQVSRIVGICFTIWATREVPQSPALEADALSIRPLGYHPLIYVFIFIFSCAFNPKSYVTHLFFSKCSNISESSSNLVFLKPPFLKSPLPFQKWPVVANSASQLSCWDSW